MSSARLPLAIVVGVGPGLGIAIARRLGRAGHRVALISRSTARHAGYVAELAADGITADAFTADVRDASRFRAVLDQVVGTLGEPDVVYYGPGGTDPEFGPQPIEVTTPDQVRHAFEWVYPAVELVNAVLPGMIARRRGGLLFAGGLSGERPMPALGALALSSAALRTYALTLHAGLAEHDVYAGILTIGGLVDRGDIFRMVTADPDTYGEVAHLALDPEMIAEQGFQMYQGRERAESVFTHL